MMGQEFENSMDFIFSKASERIREKAKAKSPEINAYQILGLKDLEQDEIRQLINEKTCSKIVATWQEKFREVFAQKYKYNALAFKAKTSVMKGDEFVDEIAEGMVGTIPVDTTVDAQPL